MRRRSFVVALCAGTILAFTLAGVAGAHVVKQFGRYSLATGWLHEPAYVGLDNAVQVIVKDTAGKPIDDVPASDFTAVVSTAGQQTAALPLNASHDPDTGLGTPGEYTAHLIPTAPGDYTFHLVGTIHGTKVDASFTSSSTTFDAVQGQADAQFPVKVPSETEVSALVSRLDARVTSTQAATDTATAAASSAADTANRAFLVGISVGGVGILFGLIGIVLGLRARRRAV